MRDLSETTPIYARALGPFFAALPAPVRRLHEPGAGRVFEGRAQIERGRGLAGLAARLLGLPKSGHSVPLRYAVSDVDGVERHARDFDGHAMVTRQRLEILSHGPRIAETIGPVTVLFALEAGLDGLVLAITGARLGPIRLPRALVPRMRATERGYGGAVLFDVSVSAPLIGPVIAYRGRLVERRGAGRTES
ncbi:MAG: DUF4166 domain-containing protein [Oceanicaulis sp.]